MLAELLKLTVKIVNALHQLTEIRRLTMGANCSSVGKVKSQISSQDGSLFKCP